MPIVVASTMVPPPAALNAFASSTAVPTSVRSRFGRLE